MTEEKKDPHYVTPEEADKKICPMSMNSELTHWCAGPKCMAWRWAYELAEDSDGTLSGVYSKTHGYCGTVRG